MDKDFFDYDEQVLHLMKKGLTIESEDEIKHYLIKYGYFNLISGYKKPFKNSEGNYKPGTKIEDIFFLYDFDRELRHIFLKYIFLIEQNAKSIISYAFCYRFGASQNAYLNVNNYDYSNTKKRKDIHKFVCHVEKQINSKQYEYMNHQRNEHGNIPLWVYFKTITLGELSKFYTNQLDSTKSEICHVYPNFREDELETAFDIVTRYRNICAHNERLFDYVYKKRTMYQTTYHDFFAMNASEKNTNIFDLLVCMKLFLEKDDFSKLVSEISTTIENLFIRTNQVQRLQLYKLMGFPENWKDICDLTG
ncbi:MAG: Abi family protein [Clostridia bacterium]|nr:Abi family protein [Clostridia bacterium]